MQRCRSAERAGWENTVICRGIEREMSGNRLSGSVMPSVKARRSDRNEKRSHGRS